MTSLRNVTTRSGTAQNRTCGGLLRCAVACTSDSEIAAASTVSDSVGRSPLRSNFTTTVGMTFVCETGWQQAGSLQMESGTGDGFPGALWQSDCLRQQSAAPGLSAQHGQPQLDATSFEAALFRPKQASVLQNGLKLPSEQRQPDTVLPLNNAKGSIAQTTIGLSRMPKRRAA